MKIRYKMGICILHVMEVCNILNILVEIWRKQYGRNGNSHNKLLWAGWNITHNISRHHISSNNFE